MRRAHDDAIGVGKRLVSCVVDVEHGVPHGGPEVVGSVSQQELEHVGVEACTEGGVVRGLGVLGVDPAGEGGSLVVDEEAAVLHCRGFLHFDGSEGVDVGVRFGGDVGEPVPRGDTNLLGDVVETEDCTTLVAACVVLAMVCSWHEQQMRLTGNNQSFARSVGRVLNHSADIRFPLSLNLAHIEFPALDQIVNQTRISNCPRNDCAFCCSCALPSTPILADTSDIEDNSGATSSSGVPRCPNRSQSTIGTGDTSKIDRYIVSRSKNTRPVRGVKDNMDRRSARGKWQTSVPGLEVNGRFAVLRQRFGAGEGGRERQDAQKSAGYHPHDERCLNLARKFFGTPHQVVSNLGSSALYSGGGETRSSPLAP